jgi:SAM-dependent methyltransferase
MLNCGNIMRARCHGAPIIVRLHMTTLRLKRPLRIEDGDGPPRYPMKEALARLRYRIYKGDRFECSCCGKAFKLFLYSNYMAALCPYCLSVERYRLLCRYLRDETDFGSKPARVLDIAPMWCFQEFCRSFDNIEYVSIDIESPMAMRHMDIRDLEFRDGLFDFLLCYHVLEHIDDDRRAISELYRVLKPGGRALIQVPIFTEQTMERAEFTEAEADDILKYDCHLRSYGKDFGERLEAAGFEVSVVDFVKRFSMEEITRYGLDCTEDIYFCRK